MCFFLDQNLLEHSASKICLFLILLGTIITIHQQIERLRSDVIEAKAKSSSTNKEVNKDLLMIREGLRASQDEVKKLKAELKLYNADKTGLMDFAYGGRVISIRDTETYESEGVAFFGFRLCGGSYLERRILESSVLPGECWPIKGQDGVAVIELVESILVTRISVEHASKQLLPDNSWTSAPKEFSLTGIPEEDPNGNSHHFFGRFVYSSTGPEVQTFFVQNLSKNPFRIVEFRVYSNHGHPDITCVYRVRIHGHAVRNKNVP